MEDGKTPPSSSFKTYVNLFSEEDDNDTEGEESPSGEGVGPEETASPPKGEEWVVVPQDEIQESEVMRPNPSTSSASDEDNRSEDKLCGYLNKYKLGSRGIKGVSNYKKRWFVYASNTCKLLYYRTPEDMIPLGGIDVAHASFSFDVQNAMTVLEVRSQGKIYLLEAPDKTTMFYWLQELQKKRRNYSQRKTKLTQRKLEQGTIAVKSGLISSDSPCITHSGDHVPCLIDSIECPKETVGEGTAKRDNHRFKRLGDITVSSWKTELRNIMSNFKPRHARSTTEDDSSLNESEDRGNNSVFYSSVDDVHVDSLPEESGVETGQRKSVGQQFQGKLNNLRNKFKKSKSTDHDCASAESQQVGCQRCRLFQDTIASQREETRVLEEELLATREIMRVLQKHVDKLSADIQSSLEMQDTTIPVEHEMIKQRDSKIVDLEHFIAIVKEEEVMLRTEVKAQKSANRNYEEQISMFKESLASKDDVVVSLTDRLAELEGQTKDTQNSTTNTTLTLLPDSREINDLKDRLHGYQMQNKFLNKEILELNQLRQDEEDRERQLLTQCTEFEAKYYQLKSKYLICLKELDTPKRDGGEDPHTQEMIARLLQEAIESENGPDNRFDKDDARNYRSTLYDKYGFAFMNPGDDDLESQADTLQKKSYELSNKAKSVDRDISTSVKWETYMVSLGDRALQRSDELKSLVRCGIPSHHRGKVWKFCIDSRIKSTKENLGPGYYAILQSKLKKSSGLNPAANQVELDLLRTLPNNKHYDNMSAEGIPKLRNVLLSYTLHNPQVGYCQGLNRLAAIALLFLNEEDAFWCLVAIIEQIMPADYYNNGLQAAHTDQRVLKDLLYEKLPRISQHMENFSTDLSLFCFNWFMTIFVDNVPVDLYLRIWDTFLYEGNKVLFRYSLALLKYKEEEILRLDDPPRLFRFLQTIAMTSTDHNRIFEIAFHDLNPFAMRHIQTKRQHHRQIVKAELEALDLIRVETSFKKRETSSMDAVSDEDI